MTNELRKAAEGGREGVRESRSEGDKKESMNEV